MSGVRGLVTGVTRVTEVTGVTEMTRGIAVGEEAGDGEEM